MLLFKSSCYHAKLLSLIFEIMKVEVFNIEDKKSAQRKVEMQMKPVDRLYLCLDLMDLNRELAKEKEIKAPPDGIQWIELTFRKPLIK